MICEPGKGAVTLDKKQCLDVLKQINTPFCVDCNTVR